jgi:hypothetical protein
MKVTMRALRENVERNETRDSTHKRNQKDKNTLFHASITPQSRVRAHTYTFAYPIPVVGFRSRACNPWPVCTNVAQRAGGITDATVTAQRRNPATKSFYVDLKMNQWPGRHPGRDVHRGPVTASHESLTVTVAPSRRA